jgi:dTDP-4-amino-4,6-dideoxygalactose transaminase
LSFTKTMRISLEAAGMHVPFLDLRRESEHHLNEFKQAMSRVLDRGSYVLGPEVAALEAEFADFVKMPYAVGVGSGTDALALALQASGAVSPGAGDEVITTDLSAAFTALAIYRAGAIPRFADVDPLTLQIDPAQAESLIGERTRAILPVHLYGNSCNILKILELADRHHLGVIEDACQAHGASLNGRLLGTFGAAAGFSFYPTKNMGGLGEGGMVVTHDQVISANVRKLRNGGQERTYHHELLGYNSRLDEIQAAILRFKLRRLEEWNELRCRKAAVYSDAFADLDLTSPCVPPGCLPNRHLFVVRTPKRDALHEHLREKGIQSLVHYPVPVHAQPALQRFVLPGQAFPAAEKASAEILSLPLYPELTEAEIQHTVGAVRSFFGK